MGRSEVVKSKVPAVSELVISYGRDATVHHRIQGLPTRRPRLEL